MIKNEKTIVSGVFKTEKELSEAVKWLDGKGVSDKDINILVSDKLAGKDFKINTTNKVPEIAIKGLATGAVAGAFLGSLMFVGIIIIPLAGIAVTGPIIGAMTGIALGSTLGAVTGALVGMTIPKYETVFFDEKSDAKNILLVTKANKSIKKDIKKNLMTFGASNIAAK